MVHATYYLHLLACVNLVASEATTYVALPAESYAVTVKDPPTPSDDEIVVQTDSTSGDINIFPGKNRQEAFTKALDGCGDNVDDKCLEKLSQAWGYGDRPESDAETGLSKRIIPVVVAAAAVGGISILLQAILLHKSDQQNGFRVPGPEVSKIIDKPAETTVFQTATDDSKPVTVIQTPAPVPTDAEVPSVKQDQDGNLEITIPEGDIKYINKALDNVVCKRQDDQSEGDPLRACVEHAANNLAQYAEVGGYLKSYKNLRYEGQADMPLPQGWDALPDEVDRTVQLLQFGTVDPTARNALGRLSMVLSWYRYEAGGQIQGKFSIPFDKLHEEKEKKEGSEECKAGKVTFFCEECGGHDKLIPGTPWKDAPKDFKDDSAKLWTCAGRSDDDKRKSCSCMRIDWPEPYPLLATNDPLPDAPRGSGGDKKDDDKNSTPKDDIGDHDLICRKANKDVRADPKQWKWGVRNQMHDRVNEYCDTKFGEGAKGVVYGPGPKKEDDYGELGWNAFRFEVKFDEKPSPEQCKKGLARAIDGCDKDKTLNQHDHTWGALVKEKSSGGRSYEVIPTRDRVYDKQIQWECNTWQNRGQKGNKGKNGVELPDETSDKMMKLEHVHAMKDMGWVTDSIDLGPVEGKGPFYRTIMTGSNGYESSHDCWDWNYGCVQDSILNQGGVVMTSTHWAGSSGSKNYLGIRCWVGFDDY